MGGEGGFLGWEGLGGVGVGSWAGRGGAGHSSQETIRRGGGDEVTGPMAARVTIS